MKSVNVNKDTNVKCEHCAFYKITSKLDSRGSEGICTFNNSNKLVKYYRRCKHFKWSPKYLSYNLNIKLNSNSDDVAKCVCKRCGRPLTDTNSIARGFGKSCYEQRLKAVQKRLKRLF